MLGKIFKRAANAARLQTTKHVVSWLAFVNQILLGVLYYSIHLITVWAMF